MSDNTPPLPSLDEQGYLKPFHIYMLCTENDVEYLHDGGKVLLQAIPFQDGVSGLNGANLPLQFAVDGDEAAETGMHAFPKRKQETRECFYKITVEEVDDPRPPAPSVPETEIARLTRENEALRQQLLASSEQPSEAPAAAEEELVTA